MTTQTDRFMGDNVLFLDGNTVPIEDVVSASQNSNWRLALSEETKERVQRAREVINKKMDKNQGKISVYGVNTGFGSGSSV